MKAAGIILLFILLNSCGNTTKQSSLAASETVELRQPEIVEQIVVDSVWAANGVGFDLKTVNDKQFIAYFDSKRMMTVASREIGSNHWTKKTLPNQLIWDSHNSVKLGIDELGYIHVSGNQHVDPLAYFRSTKSFDVNTMVAINKMVGQDEGSVTYPNFFHDKTGSLLFSYRSGTCGNGNILINRYLPKEEKWERYLEQPLFEGIEANDDRAAYHHWVKDANGDFHFAWIWRWTPAVETSHNICYAKTSDLKNWTNAAGDKVTPPFRPEDEKVLVDPTPSKGGMHNSRYKLILTKNNEPIIGYVKYDEAGNTQLYLAKFNNGEWLTKQISNWDFRWKFIDGGAFMTIGGKFEFIGISDDGIMAINWETEKGDSGRYTIDIETLTHTDKVANIQLKYPEDFRKPMTNRNGMNVRIAYDQTAMQSNGSRYLLKWEAKHGGFRQHAPEVIPDGPLSALVLLKIE
ncbi:BNR repeat-containing protein [Algibacter sp.]|uniref:BNR repeat-containing protein n=1 Tax=Algibacter sp. TaxID=1872428 RepID=UPI003C7147BA